MKIHNYTIVSTIQIRNKKKSLKKNSDISKDTTLNNYDRDYYNDYYNYDYDDDYNDVYDDHYNEDYYNERTECENCNTLFLNTLLNNGLCEICSIKRQKKLQIFRKKMNINN
jgi:hypothetical protein